MTKIAQPPIDYMLLHACLEEDFAFALSSLCVPTSDPETMKLVFAILVAMGTSRLLDLNVPSAELKGLAMETISELQRIRDPNRRSR